MAIDLASKYSAVVVLEGSQVIHQFDSVGVGSREFAQQIGVHAKRTVHAVVIEDVPAHVPWGGIVKSVCTLQGRVLQELHPEVLSRTWFVTPAVWQRSFEGVWKGKAAGALAAAERLGYSPPDLVGDPRFDADGRKPGEARRLAKKVMSDYVDAFLIARWAMLDGSLEVTKMVSRAGDR